MEIFECYNITKWTTIYVLTNPTLDYYSVFEYAFNAVDIGMITHVYFGLKEVCVCAYV